MASEHWFRWHHGSVTDPKWRVIASRCVTFVTVADVTAVWAAMLENASQANPRGELSGWDDEDIAVLFGLKTEQVSSIREAMQGKVLEGNSLISWEKRQPKREESSTDRTRQWRERQRSVTQCDASERTVTLEERRGDKIKEEKTAPKGDLLADIPKQIADDFRSLRSRLRAPITQTAMDGIRREAAKAKLPVADALAMCCERGWRGFKADWVTGNTTAPQVGTPRQRRELGT